MPSIFRPKADGYVFQGQIQAVSGLYPGLRIRYRPPAPSVLFEWQNTFGAKAKEEKAYEIVNQQLIDVTVQEEAVSPAEWQPVRLAVTELRELHAGILFGILDHCLGVVGPSVEKQEGNSLPASGSGSTPQA
jgi:hypothetical protein